MVVDAEYLENLSTDVELPEAQPDLPSVVAPQTIVNALGTLPFPLLLKDAGFRYVYANKSAAKVIGRSPEEIVGGTAADFFPADDAARFEEIERAVLASGKRVEIEQRLLNADSREAQIRVRFDRVEDAQGNHLVRSIVTDVTEVDNKLNDQIRRVTLLENSVAHMAQGLVVLRGERVEFASPRVLALLETLDDVIAPGVKWLDVLEYSFRRGDCGSDEAAIAKGMAHVNAFNERKAFRYKRRMPSGAILVFEGEPLATSDGLIITISDITEDRIKDSGLRNAMRENEVFRTMIDNIPLSIYAKTEDLKLTYVNEAWEHLVGIKAEHAIGKTDVDLMGADGLVFADDDREVLAGEVTVTFNETATNGEGEITHRIAKKRPFMTADGTRYLIGSTTDITDIRNRETELEAATLRAAAADRAKSEFLANMSHEIRTPMTSILGYSSILLEGLRDDPNLSGAAQTIQRNGEYLLELINDILDLSKIEAGALRVEALPCCPTHVVNDVVNLMQVRADSKQLALRVEYQGSLPDQFQTDPTRLRQILVNLMSNAIKFTEHGEVRLVVRGVPGETSFLNFEVHDTGIGMTGEQLGRLFQPFTQADGSTTRKFGGTGLGLSISKRLAELLGGTLTVCSAPGKGSVFTLSIKSCSCDSSTWQTPPSQPPVIEKPVKKTQPAEASRETKLPYRILLAEDGPDNQRLINYFLTRAGATVTLADNGWIALNVVREGIARGEQFDCVLMDVQMPVMDGYQATMELRRERYTGPIIALTANAMTHDRQLCLDAGCDDYATKPIDRVKLLELVDRHVQRTRQQRAAAELQHSS